MNKERWIFFGCLLLAGFFWLMQKLNRNYTITQNYSVRYTLPDGKVFRRSPASNVLVTLQGKGWDILFKSAKNIGDKIEVELNEDNTQLIPASSIAEKINGYLGSNEISVASINPSQIQIQLEGQSKKKVPVVSKLNISYFPGYYYKEKPQFQPDSIVITGAEQYLEKINSWPTAVMNINNLHESIINMPINLERPKNNLLRISEDRVMMDMEMEEYTEKEFTVPITVKNSDLKIKLLPDQVEVKCVVGLSKYDNLNASDIELYVNLDESLISPGKNVVPIAVSRMPLFVRNMIFDPKAAQYFIIE